MRLHIKLVSVVEKSIEVQEHLNSSQFVAIAYFCALVFNGINSAPIAQLRCRSYYPAYMVQGVMQSVGTRFCGCACV